MPGGVIKGRVGAYVYVSSFDTDEPVMKTIRGKRPKRMEEVIDLNDRNSKAAAQVQKMLAEAEEAEERAAAERAAAEADAENSVSAEEARIERQKLIEEYEAIRQKYEKESEEFVLRAREKATEIYEKTKEMAQQTILDAKKDAEQILRDAEGDIKEQAEEARKQGYNDGEKKGYDEGYVKALKKCKETLLELKDLSEQVTADKSELMMQYERQLFDTIFDICNRITLGVLGQKEKGLITRMIREAGKKYKASKTVKLTLSKLDISEEAEIDEQLLKDVFKNCDNVDVEILDDMPSGTLLIDDGAEITDASVMTQLKMVEQLGKGKYRDKSLGDMLQENRDTAKPKRGRRPAKADDAGDTERVASESVGDEDTAVPDVVYKTGRAADDDEDDIEKQIENA